MNESTNQSTTPSTPNLTSTCCEYFIKTLNKETSFLTINLSYDENEVKDEINQKPKELIINNNLDKSDLSSFLNFCNLWQQKQCVCIFTNEDLLEKFHHFVHNVIASCIIVIRNLKADASLIEEELETTSDEKATKEENQREIKCHVRYWSLEWKEKLFTALIKILNLNMPLYVTSKHMLLNVNNLLRFKRNTNECNCSKITNDPISILQTYCQANVSNQDLDSLPVDLLMNICLFVDLNGLYAIKYCFMNATPENLNINLAHLLFNVLVNLRIWLNFSIVEKQIFTMRTCIINYMCQLSDTDLRIAGAKNTTDLMYDSFKGYNVSSSTSAISSTLASVLNSDNQEGSSSSSSLSSTSNSDKNSFKVDYDGLKLALKYFLCSTLTIRLCGVAQMNLQISAWNDFNSNVRMNHSKKHRNETNQIELADWFMENKIIEHLFGPNLHVEVIKRSQEIMNFLAFSNRLTDKHLDVIWTSAQLKHCAKPVMDMLMSLHKHLNVESVQYLSKLVASLELNQHNEQTILLSALLTKNLWSIMLDMGEKNEHKSKSISTNKSQPKIKQERQSKSSLKNLKRSLLNHQKKLSKQTMKNKKLKSNSPMKRIVECEDMDEEEEDIKEDNSSDEYDDIQNQSVNNSKAKMVRNKKAGNEQETMDENSNMSEMSIKYSKKKEIIPQKIVKRHNQSMETQLSSEGESYEKNRTIKKLIQVNDNDDDDDEDEEEEDDDDERDENKEDYEDEDEEEDEDGNDDEDDDEDDEDEDEEEEEDDEDDEDNEEESDDETDESDDIENNQNSEVEIDEDSGDHEVDRVLNSNYRQKVVNKQVKTSLRSELIKINRAQMRMQAENQKLRAKSEDKEITEINKSIFTSNRQSNSNASPYCKEEAKSLINLINSDETHGTGTNLNNFMLLNEDENNSHSSFVSNPSSVKNMNEFDDCDELNTEEQENSSLDNMNLITKNDENGDDSNVTNVNKRDIQLGLDNICSNGHTFLWDLLMNNESSDNLSLELFDNKLLNDQNGSESCLNKKPNMMTSANEKILKEAEKQLQTLLCLPSTDKRIRYKFIENCILNLKSNRACVISLRLLTKLFSSFQQFSNSSYNLDKLNMSTNLAFNHGQNSVHLSPLQTHLVINTSPSSHHSAIGYNAPSNIIEVHRIVAYTENNCSMINLFFENLKTYTNEQFDVLNQSKSDEEKLELMSRIRVNLLTRLQFLSFIYSTLGSPKDFELVQEYVELLWDSLIRFDDYTNSNRKVCISVKDDLFNWFLNQAKNKDQHAMNIDTFKLILINKMPLLDLDNFSQNALHLYQELFKIYKYSSIQHDFTNYKQMETSVIDYIFKLAFVSRNTDVSLAAIQFLNSHFLQIDTISDVEQQSKFVEYCMNYLNEARDNLCILILEMNSSKQITESILDKLKKTSNLVGRVFLLLKNHLNCFLQRHSYQLRLFELNDQHWLSHNKQLQCLSEKIDNWKQFQNQFITLVCHVNPTQFKFNLIVSTNDCVGDLKAIIKEILFRIIKSDSEKSMSDEYAELKFNKPITFNSLLLSNKTIDYTQMYKHSFSCLVGTNPNPDSMALIKSIIDNDDSFYLKIYANGQELTSSNANATSTLLMDSKLLSDMAIKDMQTVHVNLYSHRASENKKCVPIKLDKNSIPMLFLSNEPHFTNLFRLINLLCKLNSKIKENLGNCNEVLSKNEISIEDLCRKVWEVIMILPTNKNYLSSIQNKTEWYFNELIDHLLIVKSNDSEKANPNIFENNSPYQMLYYLQIIEIIFKRQMNQNELSTTFTLNQTVWSKYLFKLLSILTVHLKDKLNKPIDEILFDNKQTCLNSVDSFVMLESISIILRLLSHLLVNHAPEDVEEIEDLNETPRKLARKNSHRSDTVLSKQVNIELLKELLADDSQYEERFLLLIFNIQTLASLASSPTQFQTVNFFYDIKIELLNNSMLLLTSCLFFKDSKEDSQTSSELIISKIKDAFLRPKLYENRLNWLKCILLYENKLNNQFRKEACSWFHRICVFENSFCVKPTLNDCILNELLGLINSAVQYKPSIQTNLCSKEYFHLVTNLISNVDANEILLNDLIKFIQSELKYRECYETPNTNSSCGLNYVEDDVLVGLLSIAIAIIKKQVINKQTDSTLFIDELFDYLFKLNKLSEHIEMPKCRSTQARCLCFDLLVELCRHSQANFVHLFDKLIVLNKSPTHLNNYTGQQQFIWDYWPRDDVRSPCGFVGLVNLGATCYMATSMQHLYMIKEARDCILKSHFSTTNKAVHDNVLFELKRLFAYLSESERKAYNPKDFCKVYTMDQQQLNTAEQKDMQEFFTDLISKLEETSNEHLKPLLKTLFGGVITNLVISLDCPHVSCTLEEFYTVRCQVAGMKDLYDSLNEITIKDTLEGDNMYTCSKCSRKVRAEKRACFRQLPKILCFNTMRYTFNMITMMKEKINTHFSFPLKLDMSGYMEKNLIPTNVSSQDVLGQVSISNRETKQDKHDDDEHDDDDECYIYELIGVTVHTGTADGGHYYSFIRDRNAIDSDSEPKWYFFNDAEVKPFDASMQLASECFGGEATSKTYDSSSDKFMDMSFEKTNSAYMLFYEKQSSLNSNRNKWNVKTNENMVSDQELFNTIRDDNLKFVNDRLLFENGYFNFVWQMCDVVPRTLLSEDTILLATQLAITFILETYIHSREKPNMMQWSEMLTKYFSTNHDACKWFIKHLIQSNENGHSMSWCAKVFLKCPNSSIRQFFQRLLIHIVKTLLSTDMDMVEMFIVKFIELINLTHKTEENAKYNIRFMSEYFMFLIEFARLGIAENMLLVKHDTLSKVARFYLRNRRPQSMSNKAETIVNSPGLSSSSSTASLKSLTSSSSSTSSSSTSSSSDSSTSVYDEIIPLHDQKSKLKVFEKLIMLISILTEQNSIYFQSQLERANEDVVCVEEIDSNTELFKKLLRKHNKLKLKFFYKSILDEINLSHIRIILFSLIRLNKCSLAMSCGPESSNKKPNECFLPVKFINMCCRSIRKLQTKRAQPSENDRCIPFFSIMGNCTITETDPEAESVTETSDTKMSSVNSSNVAEIRTDFTQLIIDKLEYLFDCAPYHTLQWLTSICPNNGRIQTWLVDNMNVWVKQLLVDNKQTNIRFSATILLANLVPNRTFRETFTSNRNMLLPYKPQQQSLSSSSSSLSLNNANESTNFELDSVECKQVLHKIIKYLFSFMDDLSQYVVMDKSTNMNDSLNETSKSLSNRLIQYFTFLIYCMISKDEKRLFVTYEQTIDKFWSIYYPHISNNHVFTNLNKQVAIHFFYQTLCPENIDYILEVDTTSTSHHVEESTSFKKTKFKSRIARELPICTVAVDHEDADLVSYNRQCLHPYYATIRLLCQQNRMYLKEMFTHSNFQWAFKHIMPFAIQYPLASQELNKFVQLFIQMKDTDDETKKLIQNFKENLATIFMMNSEVDPKQCWQSILMTMRCLIETLDDATLVLTRRGLNVLSACFFHISMIYQNNYSYQDTNSSSNDLIESIQLLMQVCEAVKHHLDKKTEGINQIIQAWKEKNELCKRLLMLVNFYNIVELRNRALDLLRMVINVSPNDTLLFVLNQIYVGFFANTPQTIVNYLTNNCNHATSGNGKQNCSLHLQLLSQAIHIMGPYFPTNKKLNMSQVSNHLNKQPRLVFNMFLPLMFVAHSHLNGSMLINQSNDYEKSLADNYAPFLTFFDWLCRTFFSRRLAESPDHVQSTKQLIDLILFISQQSILLNITFISYLVNHLVSTLENQQESVDLPGPSSSVSTTTLNQSVLSKNHLFKLISESSHLTAFLMVLINDFRYLLNRKELYEFVQLFAFKLVSNTRKSDEEKSSKLKEKQEESVETKMSLIKTIMERSCHSINEIRFYFEFIQLSKHLLAVIESVDNENSDVPNITNNIDFKSSQMLGSLKSVHLILMTSSESDMFNNEMDNYNFYKFKVQIRNFLIETTEYMRIQLSEMAKFVLNHTPRRSGDVEAQSSESNSIQNEKSKSDENLEQKCKKVKLTSDGKEEVGQETSQESVLSSILRQVEIKRKYLEHILQNLVQTLNYLNSLIASSSSEFAESENSSSSSRQSSSQHSSRSNSPVNLDEPNEQQLQLDDDAEHDQNKKDPVMSIN